MQGFTSRFRRNVHLPEGSGDLSAYDQARRGVPTLITSGRYDEATPAQMQVLRDGITGSRWVVFEDSAHLALIEETDRYLAVLEEFLDTVDAANAADAPPSGH